MPAPIILSLLVAHLASSHDEKVIDRTLDARGVEVVRGSLQAGNIKVVPGGADRITIHYVRRARGGTAFQREHAAQDGDLHVRNLGNRLVLEDSSPRLQESAGDRFTLEVSLEIQAPPQTSVELQTGSGNVRVIRMTGEVSASTGAGNLSGEGLNADNRSVSMRTGAGNVELDGRVGDLFASSGAGNIKANGLRCTGRQASFHAGAGNIAVSLREVPGDHLALNSGVGHVTLSVLGGVKAKIESRSEERKNAGAVGEYIAGVVGDGAHFRLSSGVGTVKLN